MNNHLISLTIFFPILGAILLALVPLRRNRGVAMVCSLAASLCAIALVMTMQTQSAELQASETYPWLGFFSISYDMAIDGLNVLQILLLAILFPVLIASEWNQKVGPRGMHGLFLVLQGALFGAVCTQDLFLQFFFWGLSALPIYFLVGIWGGPGREKAAFRSMVAASLGDALIFAALIFIYYSVDPHSFSLRELAGGRFAGKTFEFLGNQLPVSGVTFSLIGIGLALRAPVWPIHGWFTEVAKEAPFSVLVALSAGIVPVALYIFIRVCYLLFPETLMSGSDMIVIVGATNLVMGGLCAVSQKSLRQLIAFVCLSEVGLTLMGIGSLSTTGLLGAVYQQLIFGLGLIGFGLFAGMISDRTGHSEFLGKEGERTLGGIATLAPGITVVAGLVIASLLGFPGLGGFVGHSLVIIGSYSIHPVTVLISGAALLLASYYLFAMYRNIFLGEPAAGVQVFQDLTIRERAYMYPVVTCLLFFGVYPKPLIELIRPTVLTLLSTVK